MAIALSSTLFPPIVPTSMAGFIGQLSPSDGKLYCRFDFTLSTYNDINDIKGVHVSIVDQETNMTALTNITKLIRIAKRYIYQDTKKGTYYVMIPFDSVANNFKLNKFYKVQLRFDDVEGYDDNKVHWTDSTRRTEKLSNKTDSDIFTWINMYAPWFTQHKDNFSEWSFVCLIRRISKNQIVLNNMQSTEYTSSQIITIPFIDINGTYKNEDPADTEFLKSYNIKLFQFETGNILEQSDEIYTDKYDPNHFYYQIQYQLDEDVKYSFDIKYTTNSGYTKTQKFVFQNFSYGVGNLDVTLNVTPEDENGRMKIYISDAGVEQQEFLGNLTIRRTSSKSGFKKWEDIRNEYFEEEFNLNNYVWYDKTVESGVWYKYCIQKRNGIGARGPIVKNNTPQMLNIEHIILVGDNGTQLKIKFDPTVSNFKYNVTENQQTTLGSKYPYFKRNAKTYYRSFSIGGLIHSLIDQSIVYNSDYLNNNSVFMHSQNTDMPTEDTVHMFTSKDELYGQQKSLYKNYNKTFNISDERDFIYERFFREKVYDFLYSKNLKLFKSATEGNIIVRLTNINFTPNQTIDRMIYSFTADVVEMDQATIKNCDKYNIQKIGNYQQNIVYSSSDYFSQQRIELDGGNTDIIDLLNKKMNESLNNNYQYKIKNITYLKLEFQQPNEYLEYSVSWNNSTNSWDDPVLSKIIPQYSITINTANIIIPIQNNLTNNEILVKEYKDTDITTLKIEGKGQVYITYNANIQKKEKTSVQYATYNRTTKVGQISQLFNSSNKLIDILKEKYHYKDENSYTDIIDLYNIEIEAEQNAVVYIKDAYDDDYDRFILGTGYLKLGNYTPQNHNPSPTILDLYFGGVHLYENTSQDIINIQQYEYIDKTSETQQGGEPYTSVSQIENPIFNGVYRINNAYKIYYLSIWRTFNMTKKDVVIPNKAIVSYVYELEEGVTVNE